MSDDEGLPGEDVNSPPGNLNDAAKPTKRSLTATDVISSPPPSFTNAVAAVCIPIQRLRCGKWDLKTDSRWLEYEPSSSNLTFFWREHKHGSEELEHDHCASFRCRDISAADLRVVAKFGYFDAMIGTLTVECRLPIEIKHHGSVSLSSFVLEATFHVNHTGRLRDVLRSLRNSKRAQGCGTNTDRDQGNPTELPVKQHSCIPLREGLPDWVLFIPHRLYSPTIRRTLELVIMFYTVFSIAWACWQLYRHVDFIQTYVRPLIEALKYHIHLLDRSLQFLNTLFEEITLRWLSYMKPAYLLLSSFTSPLISIGKQTWSILSNMTGTLQVVFQPVLYIIYTLMHLLHLMFVRAPCTVLQPVFCLFSKLWSIFRDIVVVRLLATQLAGLQSLVGKTVEVLERSMRLDPLKAQLILMRSNVLNSGKAIGMGLLYIFKSIERRVWVLIRPPQEDEKED